MITKCSLATVIASSAGKLNPNPNYRPPQLPPPTTLPLRHCSHNEDSKPIGETECLLSLLCPNPEIRRNKEHYILATADAETPSSNPSENDRQKQSSRHAARPPRNEIKHGARAIPGVPIIYVKRSVMILEPMSGPSESVRDGVEKVKLRSGVVSTGGVTGKRKRDGDEDAGEDEGKEEEKKKKKKKGKGAGGPNPLSVKKPKSKNVEKAASTAGAAGKSNKADDGAAPAEEKRSEGQTEQGEGKVKTKRKRRHKSSKQDGGNAAVEGDDTAMDVES